MDPWVTPLSPSDSQPLPTPSTSRRPLRLRILVAGLALAAVWRWSHVVLSEPPPFPVAPGGVVDREFSVGATNNWTLLLGFAHARGDTLPDAHDRARAELEAAVDASGAPAEPVRVRWTLSDARTGAPVAAGAGLRGPVESFDWRDHGALARLRLRRGRYRLRLAVEARTPALRARPARVAVTYSIKDGRQPPAVVLAWWVMLLKWPLAAGVAVSALAAVLPPTVPETAPDRGA
jgi:hypothetical protein